MDVKATAMRVGRSLGQTAGGSADPRAAPTGFRMALRAATAPQHDRLDAAISRLDIAERGDFILFCQIHQAAFRQMDAAAHSPLLPPMITALDSDLAMLGAPPPDTPLEASLPDLEPLALRYLLEGSRMGTQVLRRRWQTSDDPVVQRARCYFSAPTDPKSWRALCAALDQVPLGSAQAQKIAQDAIRLFDLFLATAQAVLPKA